MQALQVHGARQVVIRHDDHCRAHCRYTVSDSSGNTAEAVFRRLRLVSPCSPPERWCTATQACSFNGVCSAAAAGLSSLLSSPAFAGLSPPASADDSAGEDDYDYLYYAAEDGEEDAVADDAAGGTLVDSYGEEEYAYEYSDDDSAVVTSAAEVAVEEEKDVVAPVVRVEKRLVRPCCCDTHACW